MPVLNTCLSQASQAKSKFFTPINIGMQNMTIHFWDKNFYTNLQFYVGCIDEWQIIFNLFPIFFPFIRYWTMDRTLQRQLQKTNYQQIRQICRDRGCLFEDPDFLPTNKSISSNRKPPKHPIVWLRPHVRFSSIVK